MARGQCGQLALELSKRLWATPLWELSKAAVGYLWANGFAVVHR